MELDTNLILTLVVFFIEFTVAGFAILLAFFAIWQSSRFEKESREMLQLTIRALSEIRNITRSTEWKTEVLVGKALDHLISINPAKSLEDLKKVEESLRIEKEQRLLRVEEQISSRSNSSAASIGATLDQEAEREDVLDIILKRLEDPLSLVILTEALDKERAPFNRFMQGYPGIPPGTPEDTHKIVDELERYKLVKYKSDDENNKWVYPSSRSQRHSEAILKITLPLIPPEVFKPTMVRPMNE